MMGWNDVTDLTVSEPDSHDQLIEFIMYSETCPKQPSFVVQIYYTGLTW